MKNLIFTFLLSFIFIGNTFCQVEKDRKWSIEIGGVYNQWHQIYNIQNGSTDTTLYDSWAKLRVMPSLRINRQFKLRESVYLKPFIGASVNGTQTDISFFSPSPIHTTFGITPSEIDTDEFIDYAYYYIPQIEVGTFADFTFKKSNLQLGIKAQYHLTLWTNHEYIIFPDEPFRIFDLVHIENRKYTLDDLYRRFNMNLGIRYQYNLNRFLIGIEGWYGMRDMIPSSPRAEDIGVTIHTTNLRLMVGYTF